MRDLYARMLSAVLGGEGLQGVADLAAGEAGGPVAILLPARGLSASSPKGTKFSHGAVALATEVRSRRPRGAAALIESEWPGSLAELKGARVHAILPARGGDDAPERAQESASTGFSSGP